MKKKALTAAVLTTALLSACASPAAREASPAADGTAQPASAQESVGTMADQGEDQETAVAETTGEALKDGDTEKASGELTGKGQGFGGTITAYVTVVDGAITEVTLEGPDETPGIGGAALEELEGQFVSAKGTDIDGVSGATVTSQGAVAAVLNALDPEANPFEEPETAGESAAEIEPVVFPDDKKIVSATTYGIYTKSAASFQDAVLKTTLYWNQTDDQVYDIRFLQAMLPWDDNGASGGWANITNKNVVGELGEAVISFTGDEHGSQVECAYAQYIQIGDILWTGELGSDPACEQAVVYRAEIGGETVRLNDYVATEDGGAWYHEAALEDVYILKTPETAEAGSDNIAQVYRITYKETNGHGEGYWMSDLKFSGNMQAIKDFVTDNGFGYDYYKDGGITQNEDKYWQTPDDVSGATLDEVPTYLDTLKLLYERIQSGEYTEEN